jgi:hypothetical protein
VAGAVGRGGRGVWPRRAPAGGPGFGNGIALDFPADSNPGGADRDCVTNGPAVADNDTSQSREETMDELAARIRQILATTPERWLALTDSVEPEALRRPAAEGEWSPVECLAHLIDTEVGAFQVRLEFFLAGRDRLAAFDPDAAGMRPDPKGDPRALARRFADARARSLEALERVAIADLDRVADHAEYGSVTLRAMLNEWPAHDLNHTIQAERALMQPYVTDCGPWRGTFADHDLAKAE